MVLKMTINVKDAQKAIKSSGEAINKDTKGALGKAALFMQGEVKLSIAGQRAEPTSVDTGRFLNSIDFSVSYPKAYVYTELDYPVHLEFGTSTMAPRKHFTNSIARNQKKVEDIFKSEITK